jgi:hypothetical protein
MIKNLVVGGCSYTQDYRIKTWPNYLAERMGWQLINVGARGAGIDFVSKRLIIELQDYDPQSTTVVIMLPSSDRFDLYVDKEHPLKNDLRNIASWQGNEYPELVNLDGSKSTEHGYSLTGGHHRGYKKYYYKFFYNYTYSEINYWFNVISLQNYLNVRRFTSLFTSVYNLDNIVEQESNRRGTLEFTKMYDLVDWTKFKFYKQRSGFLDFVADHNYECIDYHPVTEAHAAWAESILIPNY